MIFTKYSAIENPESKDNSHFLRHYTYCTLYNKSGKTQFLHEHMIFISNYFINKLGTAEHMYIYGTFLYPPGFNQLIVILFRDEFSGKRYPALFALINNKKFEGYKTLFEKIYNILTLEHSINFNVKSYIIDFEKSLINSTRIAFPNIRQIGCYYHYCRNIREKDIELGMIKDNNKEFFKELLNEYYKAPFLYYKNYSIFIEIKNKYI